MASPPFYPPRHLDGALVPRAEEEHSARISQLLLVAPSVLGPGGADQWHGGRGGGGHIPPQSRKGGAGREAGGLALGALKLSVLTRLYGQAACVLRAGREPGRGPGSVLFLIKATGPISPQAQSREIPSRGNHKG